MRNVHLYDYQLEMKRQIETAFGRHRSVMVQMPTGTGKTVLLASIVKEVVEQKMDAFVWIVVHRRELVTQIEGTLERVLDTSADEGISPLCDDRKRIRVLSIQWLSRHYREMAERPALMVIDEAHHAVARTYAEVLGAYPDAKILGVTATPCRLTRHGFTDLFDVLLQSWSNRRFVAEGRLSLYDYLSVKVDSEDQRLVWGLRKRGADGDFSLREMSEKLDVRPSIERLCDTVLRYASGKKGIVYAIDIEHAEHIAEAYREQGIKAVVISSKTPSSVRCQMVEWFRGGDAAYSYDLDAWLGNTGAGFRNFMESEHANGRPSMKVLVNVDLFGEGFDCPDVEFIQLARPTLSLAKYLQQVGRGMRVHEGKAFCLILDNVGSYRLFGLPSDDHDWQAMFEGRLSGKGNLPKAMERLGAACSVCEPEVSASSDAHTELVTILTHEGQRKDLEAAYGYELVGPIDGAFGVVDSNGCEVLPCVYSRIELKAYGFACLHSRRKIDRERPWMDLRNGVRFFRCPRMERHGALDFSTVDGVRFYPRVRTRLLGEQDFVTQEALKLGLKHGLRFRGYFVSPSEPERLYVFKEQVGNLALFETEGHVLAWRGDWDPLVHRTNELEWGEVKASWERRLKGFEEEVRTRTVPFVTRMRPVHLGDQVRLCDYEELGNLRMARTDQGMVAVSYRPTALERWSSLGTYRKVFPTAYDLRVVQNWDGKYVLRSRLFCPLENREILYDFAELEDFGLLHFQVNGVDYWLCLENLVCFTHRPVWMRMGFLEFLRDGDLYFLREYDMGRLPYRFDEIRLFGDICFLGNRRVIVKSAGGITNYFVQRRSVDGMRFVLSDRLKADDHCRFYRLFFDGGNDWELSVMDVLGSHGF